MQITNHCPYCSRLIKDSSEDHIFNAFLGGKRTIPACRKKCNNDFGSQVEGKLANTALHQMMISLINWGVPLKQMNVPRWSQAFEIENHPFDMIVENGKVTYKLSRPIREFDQQGNLISMSFDNSKYADKAVSNQRKRKISQPIETIRLEGKRPSPISYTVDSNMELTALKMCTAVATWLPEFEPLETLLARLVLSEQKSIQDIVTLVADDYPQLEKLHSPLDHLVYVERFDSKVIGVVQFFGMFQMYCLLGRSDITAIPTAWLGTLDVVSGEEKFIQLKVPLGLVTPEDPYSSPNSLLRLINNWNQKLEQAATAHGATTPIKLSGKIETNCFFKSINQSVGMMIRKREKLKGRVKLSKLTIALEK